MEFRAPHVADQMNAVALEYLTKNLNDPEDGRSTVDQLIKELGNSIRAYPDWHPILTAPNLGFHTTIGSMSELPVYNDCDHTIQFVRGFVTCPYSEEAADRLVESINTIASLSAYRLPKKLYSERAFPVVVEANNLILEADGTIRSRDAIALFLELSAQEAKTSQVAETWWNVRANILGRPHGARSSLLVNQHSGGHMRKILETLNNSGVFGPIKESSLDMLSNKKLRAISENLLISAVSNWQGSEKEFTFELRGELCYAIVNDTWKDGHELSVRVKIGDYDLYVSGFHYPKEDRTTFLDPRGKRAMAEKFV